VPSPEFVIDFPHLGDLIDGWVTQHCLVPDGFDRGAPFVYGDWQFWVTANHWRVKEDALWIPERPLRNQAFVYRRSQIVAPQKTGKGPMSATHVAVEAVGPSLFGGWAVAGDVWDCKIDGGCPCGWYFEYEPGEPKGLRQPSPLIQITATSEDQADNIYRPFRSMVQMGPLGKLMKVREGFTRIMGANSDDPDLDRVDVVTAAANSKLGNPISAAFQDESGLYVDSNKMRKVAETQRRGAAGMGGRTMETTNPWDPAEDSVAQRTFESQAPDIFKFYRVPPPKKDGTELSYKNKRERAIIHAYVYEGSPWVDLASIEAEAVELMEHNPAQAERFFGNRLVRGHGAWMPDGLWAKTSGDHDPSLDVCLSFDGSESSDWTIIKAETLGGHLFTPSFGVNDELTIWNPDQHGGRIPRAQVHAAVEFLFKKYRVARMYCDPPYWQSEIEGWAMEYGDEVVVEWATRRVTQMHESLERFLTDLGTGKITHDECVLTARHIANARKVSAKGSSADRYILQKPSQTEKIDLAVGCALVHEAACDARVDGWGTEEEFYCYVA
jgi:Phage Terminase